MIVLDADSLMSGAAIRALADAMEADPEAGLIQSFPVLISAETLFGRMQEFATSVYGWLLAEGLALWSGSEGNYWGHNAIIRTRAFAESAHLPKIGRDRLILSHDFVEAGMLRRAGWAVRFVARPNGSFEETPPTLIDYILRDRRWCRGNMQHLRLLGIRGFHPISRFHLLQGAASYLLSPAWFALLVVWSAFMPMAGAPESYFSPANPLYPVWPAMSEIDGVWFLVLIYTMLLMPKVIAAGLLAQRREVRKLYGNGTRFAATTLFEIVLAVLYAPILMVQQTSAVVRAMFASGAGWAPAQRSRVAYSWPVLLRFHWLEMVIGSALSALMVTGDLSLWLLPVATSLTLAPVFSWLSGQHVAGLPFAPLRLESPVNLKSPRVADAARAVAVGHARDRDDRVPPRAWIVRVDGRGTVLWERFIDGRGWTFFSDIAVTPEGLVASGARDRRGWAVAFDLAGTILWQRQLGEGRFATLGGVAALPGGGTVVAGGSGRDRRQQRRALVARLDPRGTVLWEHTVPAGASAQFEAAAVLEDGTVLLAGNAVDADPRLVTGFVARTDADGRSLRAAQLCGF